MPINLRPDFDERTEVLYRLSRIETVLSRLSEGLANQGEWLTSEEFCQQVGIAPKQLTYYMSKGVPSGSAVRNIGTPARPRYRFHKVNAVNQFLNRGHNQ